MFLGTLVRDVRRALRRLFIMGAAVVLLGTASNQVLDRGFIYSNIGTLFTWSGSSQAWSGSHQAATYQDFTLFIKNNGSCIPGGLTNAALIDYSHATGCAINATQYSGTITSGNYEGEYYSSQFINPSWVCHLHSATAVGSYSTGASAQPPSAATPMSVSVTGLSLSSGTSSVWDVDLVDPGGTTRAHFTGTGATFSQTVSSVVGGGTGTWVWQIYSSGGTPACDSTDGTITPGDYVSWTGTSFTYYQ